MKKSKFTESQIVAILTEVEKGQKVSDVCRYHGISQPTYYQWKNKYGGADVNTLKRIKELETELARYKRKVGEQAMDIEILKEVISKKL